MIKQTLTMFLLLAFLLINASSFAGDAGKFDGIISLHNNVRAKHQQKPLSWSNSLAQYAQQWVNNLATTQNCEMIHRPNNDDGKFKQKHGENLFWASALEQANGGNTLQAVTAKNVIEAWAEEEQFYDYQNNKCQSGEDCGHYTQMVWHESQQVGCALAVCPDKSQIWACNYHPRGNFIGEWPY